MLESSHNCTMERVGNNLSWQFKDVQLPPISETDPLQGHGFVTFQVKPVAAGVGDLIPNTASIYFDFNPAIVTNTFETHFVETLANNDFEKDGLAIYPNPAQNSFTVQSAQKMQSVVLYDVTGKKISETTSGEMIQKIDTSQLAPGLYLVEILSGSNQRSVKKLIKQ